MEPLHVDRVVLVRGGLPELWLRPGALLSARVAERTGTHGLLMLAGAPLVAELPDEVEAGQRLRLVVREADSERVTLQIVRDNPAAAAAAAALPMPDGRFARVRGDDEDADGRGSRPDADEIAAVALVYDSPTLGTLRLRLALTAGAVRATVAAAPGAPVEHARAHATQLRAALESAVGCPATVEVTARREPLDVYA